jgi:hypothetical protein
MAIYFEKFLTHVNSELKFWKFNTHSLFNGKQQTDTISGIPYFVKLKVTMLAACINMPKTKITLRQNVILQLRAVGLIR